MSYPTRDPHPYDGLQREGKPKGKYTEDGGIPRYSVVPGAHIESFDRIRYAKIGLLFLSDKMGICHDSMMLADQFAAAGLQTVICDYVGVAEGPTGYKRKTAQRTEAAAQKIIDDAIKYLIGGQNRATKKNRIVLAGYGCGVHHVLRLLARPDVPNGHAFVAGFVASPDVDPSGSVLGYGTILKPVKPGFFR
ncbi:hypothetical protein BKA61DRAFT_656290 [Leptodontidium sp. MPI-SDFR-AT-0119]|nr:hypothetical protein BKA61DRAFT_656290 [Leptodontidium sp. MPI-SDFR-AT-0119]